MNMSNMSLIQVLEQDLAALRPPVTSRVETDQDLTLDVEGFHPKLQCFTGHVAWRVIVVSCDINVRWVPHEKQVSGLSDLS